MVSRLHLCIGKILRTSPLFANFISLEEVPARDLFPYLESGRHRFDWVIPALRLIVEGMGEHHARPTSYGGRVAGAEVAFRNQVQRDASKRAAAHEAGWVCVDVWYDEEVTEDLIHERYLAGLQNLPDCPRTEAKRSRRLEVPSHVKESRREHFRELRRKRKSAPPREPLDY